MDFDIDDNIILHSKLYKSLLEDHPNLKIEEFIKNLPTEHQESVIKFEAKRIHHMNTQNTSQEDNMRKLHNLKTDELLNRYYRSDFSNCILDHWLTLNYLIVPIDLKIVIQHCEITYEYIYDNDLTNPSNKYVLIAFLIALRCVKNQSQTTEKSISVLIQILDEINKGYYYS